MLCIVLHFKLLLVVDAPACEDALVGGEGLLGEVGDPVGVGGRAEVLVDEAEEVDLVLAAGEALEVDGA